jgi:hypothetical protein
VLWSIQPEKGALETLNGKSRKAGGIDFGVVIPWGRDHDYAAHERLVAEANAIVDRYRAESPDAISIYYSTVSDITWLTDEILKHPEFSQVVARAGIDGDFSEEEEAALDRFLGALKRQRGWKMPRDAGSMAVPAALARRVAAGVFEDVNGLKARDFVFHNILRPRIVTHEDGTTGLLSGEKPIAHVREFLYVAEAIHANPEMRARMERIVADVAYEDEGLKGVSIFVDRIAMKLGMYNRKEHFAGTIALNRMIAKGEIKSFYEEKALAFMKRRSEYKYMPCCTFEGPSNVQ